MQIQGAIYPVSRAVGFTRAAWRQLVATRPEFRPLPPREGRNPFTGAVTMFPVPADTAEVVLNGQVVGGVSWSMSDELLVNVSVTSAAMALVEEWAAALGGVFHPESAAQ